MAIKKITVRACIIALLAGMPENPGMAIAASTDATYCVPAVMPTAKIASALNMLLANQSGPGWIGGDSTYSTQLPDGREAFVFSDTFIGTARPDGTATLTGMPRNTELVGTISALNSDYGGFYVKPDSLIPDSNAGRWFWAFATYSENNNQLIYVNEFNNQNIFGKFNGISGVAVLTVPSGKMPQFSKLILLPADLHTAWGRAVVQDSTYNFIYGMATDPVTDKFAGVKVARVPRGHSTDLRKWQYWDGNHWVNSKLAAVPVSTGNELEGVMRQPGWMGSGYMAVSIPNGVFSDTTFDVSFACSPQGPWSNPAAIYTLPEITGPLAYKNEIAYLPTVHPELDGESNIIVSYNINTTDGFAAYKQNIHIYQPRFLTLGH